jgi:hypothetical protein
MKFNLSIVRFFIISLITFAGALWLYIKGPISVIRGTTALDEMVPFWYMVTAFPVLGMLVADFLTAFRKFGLKGYTVLFFSQILILLIISNIRLSLQIPISGHVFLFVFFIFNRIFAGNLKNNFSKLEFVFTIILLLIITYIKLVWWTDLPTLSVGIVAGFTLAIPTLIFKHGNIIDPGSSPG